MSDDMDKADDNLTSIKNNLETMSENVSLISDSLSQYQKMIGESQASMENLKSMLTNFQNQLGKVVDIAALVFGLFLVWLLAAQVVIFSQGWELYHGTAGRMDAGAPKVAATDAAIVE